MINNSEESIWLAQSFFRMAGGYGAISGISKTKEGKNASKEKKNN